MATINTLQDLTQALRDNPEWREEIRRALLSAELLALPDTQASLAAEVRDFVAATNRRFDSVDRDIAETRKDIAEMKKDIAVLQKDVIEIRKDIAEIREFMAATNRHFESVDRSIDELRRDVRAIHGITQRQQTDFQNFRGQFAENTARNKSGEITMMVGISIGKRLIRDRILTRDDLSAFTNAADVSHIPYNELISFIDADLVIEAHDMQDASDTCFIIVEASYTCHPEDAARAQRHAQILRAFTRKPAYPVVSGVRIHHAVQDALNGGNERSVLWHPIQEEALDA